MFADSQLDKELEIIDFNTEDGIKKINQAQKLLPLHYNNLMEVIGGEIQEDFELERLPKSIQKMTKIFEIEAPALGVQTNSMVASMAYAQLFGKFRPIIRDVLVSKKADIPANIFTLSFMNSGDGKDKSFDLGKEILKEADTLITHQMLENAETKAKQIAVAKNRAKQQLEKVEESKIIDDDTGWMAYLTKPHNGFIKMATYEGFLATAEEITNNGKLGNLFIAMSELGNSLKLDPNIDRLMLIIAELYDVGKAPEDLKKTKELKTGAIEGLAPSMLAHTSPAPLLKDPKLVDRLKNIMASYFARRAFVLFTTLNESVKNIELSTNLDQQVKDMLNNTHATITDIREIEIKATTSVNRLLNGENLHVLKLTEEAQLIYGKYFLLNKYYRRLAYMRHPDFQTDGLLTELVNRHWRAIKLAGIWALADNTSTITKEILASAIYYTEYIGRGLRKLMDIIDLEVHERFIRAINENDIDKTIRFDMLIKQNYINKADKNQISNLLTAVNSGLQGKAVVLADYQKSILTIEEVVDSDNKYGFSYLKCNPVHTKEQRTALAYKGFKYYKTNLLGIAKLLTQDAAYSPFEYNRGYRNDDNVKGTTNYIVLDVDNSDIDIEILHETYLSGTLHILATTSDPTNKHKFRVVIPIKQQLGTNNSIYKYVIQRIADELMLDIDLLGRSQVMFAYTKSQVLHNIKSNLKPMDISSFIKDAANEVQTPNYNVKLTKAQQKKVQNTMLNDFEGVFKRAIYASDGTGSIGLFVASQRMLQAGCDARTITLLINKINSCWSSPMDQKRLNKIIKQATSKLKP